MPRMSHAVVAIASALGATLVAVTVAGPLDPPAGPVTATDPDLGQILGAIQGESGSCGNARGVPGDPAQGRLTLNGIGSSDVLEHDAGAFFSGGVSIGQLSVTRVPDAQSVRIIESVLRGSVVTASLRVGDGSGITINFPDATITGFGHTQRATCDGVRHAEELVITPGRIITYTGNGITVRYDTGTGVVTTE